MPYMIPAAVFAVLYLAFRHIKPLGNIIRFVVEIVVKPLNRLKELLTVFKVNVPSNTVKYPGLRTIVVVLFLVLSVIALSADIFGSLQALTALLGGDVTLPSLPSWFTYSMAALLTSTSAIYGGIWLEGLNVLPEEARLFEAHNQEQVKKFRRLIGAGFWLSMAANFFYFTLRPFFQANPSSTTTHALQVLVFLLLGLLLPLVGSLCLFLVALGLQAVLVLAARIGLLVVSILSDVCEYLASHFGKQPAVQAQRQGEAPPLHSLPAMPPLSLFQLSNSESEVVSMADAFVSVICVPPFDSRLWVFLQTYLSLLGAESLIRTYAFLDRNKPFVGSLGKGKNISIPSTGGAIPETLINKLVQEHLPLVNRSSLLLIACDCHAGRDVLSVLPEIDKRLSSLTIMIVTEVSPYEKKLPDVSAFFEEIQNLNDKGIRVIAIEVDPQGTFATLHGVSKLLEFTAHTLVTLISAPFHYPLNLSPFDIVQEVRRVNAVWSLTFASCDTVPGTTPKRAFWQKLFTKKAVSGSLPDMLTQAKEGSRQVWESVTLAEELPRHLFLTVPLQLNDKRFSQFAKEADRELHALYPSARISCVSGNGIAYKDTLPWSPRVGVSCLFPLPVQQQVGGEDTKEIVLSAVFLKSSHEQTEEGTIVVAAAPVASALVEAEAVETPPAAIESNGHGHKRSTGRPRLNGKK